MQEIKYRALCAAVNADPQNCTKHDALLNFIKNTQSINGRLCMAVLRFMHECPFSVRASHFLETNAHIVPSVDCLRFEQVPLIFQCSAFSFLSPDCDFYFSALRAWLFALSLPIPPDVAARAEFQVDFTFDFSKSDVVRGAFEAVSLIATYCAMQPFGFLWFDVCREIAELDDGEVLGFKTDPNPDLTDQLIRKLYVAQMRVPQRYAIFSEEESQLIRKQVGESYVQFSHQDRTRKDVEIELKSKTFVNLLKEAASTDTQLCDQGKLHDFAWIICENCSASLAFSVVFTNFLHSEKDICEKLNLLRLCTTYLLKSIGVPNSKFRTESLAHPGSTTNTIDAFKALLSAVRSIFEFRIAGMKNERTASDNRSLVSAVVDVALVLARCGLSDANASSGSFFELINTNVLPLLQVIPAAPAVQCEAQAVITDFLFQSKVVKPEVAHAAFFECAKLLISEMKSVLEYISVGDGDQVSDLQVAAGYASSLNGTVHRLGAFGNQSDRKLPLSELEELAKTWFSIARKYKDANRKFEQHIAHSTATMLNQISLNPYFTDLTGASMLGSIAFWRKQMLE